MNHEQQIKDQLRREVDATLKVIMAVAEAIRELKQVPSDHLYAQLMPLMDLPLYERIISTLKNVGLVTETNHLLQWVEPVKKVVPFKGRIGYVIRSVERPDGRNYFMAVHSFTPMFGDKFRAKIFASEIEATDYANSQLFTDPTAFEIESTII